MTTAGMTRAASRQERLDREEQAWRLRLKGKTEREIATALGVSQPTVNAMLARVEQRVLADAKALVLRIKARQHGRLEELYVEALAAYERSKRQGGKTIAETIRATANPTDAPTGTKTRVEQFERDGDPAWLGVLLQIHDRIVALWGLNAPAKVQQVREPSAAESMTDAALLVAAEREVAEARLRLEAAKEQADDVLGMGGGDGARPRDGEGDLAEGEA